MARGKHKRRAANKRAREDAARTITKLERELRKEREAHKQTETQLTRRLNRQIGIVTQLRGEAEARESTELAELRGEVRTLKNGLVEARKQVGRDFFAESEKRNWQAADTTWTSIREFFGLVGEAGILGTSRESRRKTTKKMGGMQAAINDARGVGVTFDF